MSYKYQTLLGDTSINADDIYVDSATFGKIQITSGPGLNLVLTSDASGNASWQTPGAVTLSGDAHGLSSSTIVSTLAGGTIAVSSLALTSALTTEVTRASAAESTLTTNLATEVTRATGAESTITTSVTTERTRATAAESTLTTNVSTLTTNLASEVTRATGAESTLTTNLNSEISRATASEGTITTSVTTERTRATAAEGTLTTNLASEVTRATAAEAAIVSTAVTLTGAQTVSDKTLYNCGYISTASSTVNIKQIALYDGSVGNQSSHNFIGFGRVSGSFGLRYQIANNSVFDCHKFTAMVTPSTSQDLMLIYGTGQIYIPSTSYINNLGALWQWGVTNIYNTTNSTSNTTGAIINSGGMGMAGDLYCPHVYSILHGTADTCVTIPGLSGDVTTAGNVITVNSINGNTANSGNVINTLVLRDGTGDIFATTGRFVALRVSGSNIFSSSTSSTSTTTGALVVTGGLGVGGNIYSQNLNASGIVTCNYVTANTFYAPSATGGNLFIYPSGGIANILFLSNITNNDVIIQTNNGSGGGIRIETSGNVYPTNLALSPNLGVSGARWNTLYATNGTINTSDRNEKTNIQPLMTGMDLINTLSPVTYLWKTEENRGTSYGLIAQDVFTSLEILGITDSCIFDKGTGVFPNDPTYDPNNTNFGLNYAQLIPVLINGIKELGAKVTDLTSRLAAIEAKMNSN